MPGLTRIHECSVTEWVAVHVKGVTILLLFYLNNDNKNSNSNFRFPG